MFCAGLASRLARSTEDAVEPSRWQASGRSLPDFRHRLPGEHRMCGIAGIIDPVLTSDESAIEAMIADITYRGPDAAGRICLQPDGIALGHRRLSILDLSDAARQPMASADGRYWI